MEVFVGFVVSFVVSIFCIFFGYLMGKSRGEAPFKEIIETGDFFKDRFGTATIWFKVAYNKGKIVGIERDDN